MAEEKKYEITISDLSAYIGAAAFEILPEDAKEEDVDKYAMVAAGITDRVAKHLDGSDPLPEDHVALAKEMCLIRYGYPVILSGKSAFTTIPDTEEAENKVKNSTEYHLQPTSQVREGVDGVMYRTYRLLRGSRTYNTEEMSRLISGLITMCKEAQIPDREIATPEEKRLLKERYGVDV